MCRARAMTVRAQNYTSSCVVGVLHVASFNTYRAINKIYLFLNTETNDNILQREQNLQQASSNEICVSLCATTITTIWNAQKIKWQNIFVQEMPITLKRETKRRLNFAVDEFRN